MEEEMKRRKFQEQMGLEEGEDIDFKPSEVEVQQEFWYRYFWWAYYDLNGH